MSENLKEYTEKLVQNIDAEKIKTPSVFSDLKAWRTEHGLVSPAMDAYVRVQSKKIIIMGLVGYTLGILVGRAI